MKNKPDITAIIKAIDSLLDGLEHNISEKDAFALQQLKYQLKTAKTIEQVVEGFKVLLEILGVATHLYLILH